MKLTIKNKLTLLSISLVLFPLTLGVWLTGQNSLSLINEELSRTNNNALISIREQKKQQFNNYKDMVEGQIVTMSSSQMIIGAMDEFGYSFEDYQSEVQNNHQNLVNYYQSEFAAKYKTRNGNQPDLGRVLPNANTVASALQTTYIANSSAEFGQKHTLDYAQDSSTYSKVHQLYHPSIRTYLEKFGYSDIFLISADTGSIVYSVFKEVDYATDLISGPYADSALGVAYKQALSLSAGEFYVTPFQPYLPAYEALASFVAAPIYDAGSLMGVLVFQVPVNRLSELMTNNQEWQKVGLGNTGETFLVAQDKTLRSENRLFIESKNEYLSQLRQHNQGNQAQTIDMFNTAVGVQQVNNQSVNQALAGKTGTLEVTNYRDATVLSAFTPIEGFGETWALISEIDQDEAFEKYNTLESELIWLSLLTVATFMAIGGGAGSWFANKISNQIRKLSVVMDDISKGDGDLTARISESSNDELGDISHSFNEIISNFHTLITDIKATSEQILLQSDNVHEGAKASQQVVDHQVSATQSTVSALEEFEASIKEVAHHSNSSQSISQEVVGECLGSSDKANQAAQEIEHLMNNINGTSDAINELNAEVSDITTVLDVINSIADQTNLLALNAAIEAARAGEHGRGFSVVAEEVRSLAMRTQDSTVQIQSKLETLDKITKGAVGKMTDATKVAQTGAEKVYGLKETLDQLVQRVNDMEQLIVSVATATEQQSQTIGEINHNMLSIDEQTKAAESQAKENETSSVELTRVANHINTQVSKFKL